MPWREVTEMSEKERFISLAKKKSANISVLCREFGISRTLGYKLLKRCSKEGKNGLLARSKKPKHSPNKVNRSIEKLILKARDQHPSWGGIKIKAYLESNGHEGLPSEKTINNILKRNGRICSEESKKHKPYIRFEHANPNDLWQIDFKGNFKINKRLCYPLTLLDDHSRYSLLIKACKNERKDTVKPLLIDAFKEYGLPLRMTMDNGNPWGFSGVQLYTELSAWLIRLGITVSHSRPGHPQTQGKIERFHRTLKLEVLSNEIFTSFNSLQNAFDEWRTLYNEIRPHAAIDNKVPSSRYQRSKRPFPSKLPAFEYDSNFEVRKVQKSGEIHYNGRMYRVGQAFKGHPIGIKHTEINNLVDVYFCHQRVAKIELSNFL